MIFEFDNYIKYIKFYTKSLPSHGRGFKSLMAKQLKCKTSFISQVLSESQNLSLDQAFLLNELFKHSEAESKYFLTLVQIERAEQKGLKKHLRSEAEKIRNDSLKLKNKITADSIKSKEDEFKYFSSADYAYVHILTTIPEFQNKESLLKKLNLNPNYLEKILNYLLKMGYVEYKHGRYLPGPSILHLPNDSTISSTHHTNWRVQAIKACQAPSDFDLHYSSIVSISEKDFLTIKALMVKHIQEYRSIINPSPCEKAYSLCFDFYEMK